MVEAWAGGGHHPHPCRRPSGRGCRAGAAPPASSDQCRSLLDHLTQALCIIR
jgi:hypothetical protein